MWTLVRARGLGGICSGDARPFEELAQDPGSHSTHLSDIVIKTDKLPVIKELCATFHSLTAMQCIVFWQSQPHLIWRMGSVRYLSYQVYPKMCNYFDSLKPENVPLGHGKMRPSLLF